MNRRVLIVSPHFPPINAADHQRVRMSLPYFKAFGWTPTVIAVEPDCVVGVEDPLLIRTVPKTTEIVRTQALPVEVTQRFGLGTLGWRCLLYVDRAGTDLLTRKTFDLVYFSTTAFPVLSLARKWYRRFKVPYVIDFQDPWVSDYHKQNGTSPPGGRLKYTLNQMFARWQEPRALRYASHAIGVSPKYPKMLCDRYPWLQPVQCSELPFGAPEADFELLRLLKIKQTIFDPEDGLRHWVYVGRGGSDMSVAIRLLFAGIKQLRQDTSSSWKPTKLHFIGTSYAPANKAVETIMPIAKEYGLEDVVEERTQRIPYFEAMKVLTDSDAILLIGSNDPSYTASKLYPCILARKPILAVFHQQSSVVDILQASNAGKAVTFNSSEALLGRLSSMKAGVEWLLSLPRLFQPETNWSNFEPYTAREMTRKQCEIFDRCVTESAGVAQP